MKNSNAIATVETVTENAEIVKVASLQNAPTAEQLAEMFNEKAERVETEFPYFNVAELEIKKDQVIKAFVTDFLPEHCRFKDGNKKDENGEDVYKVTDAIKFSTVINPAFGVQTFIYSGSKIVNFVKKYAEFLPLKLEIQYLGKSQSTNGFKFDDFKITLVK